MPLVINEISVHISSNDNELEIFSSTYDDEITATGWIASEVSKEFAVHWMDRTGKENLTVAIHVDGRFAQRLSHRPCDTTKKCDGVYASEISLRPFTFSELVLIDDDALLGTKNTSDKIGTIEVLVTRCEGFSVATEPFRASKFDDIGPIHEKSKKAGVHAVTLGDVKSIQCVAYLKDFGTEKEPCARFVFRYRPIDLLRAHGLAPPAPKPSKRGAESQDPDDAPGPSDPKRQRQEPGVKSETLSDDEEDENSLEEQLALLQSRLEKKRAKKTNAVVKREMSPIRVPIASDDEVIDLTSSP